MTNKLNWNTAFREQVVADDRLARQRGIVFEICFKAARAAKWETQFKTDALQHALEYAASAQIYEAGVFAVFPDGLGFSYWKSLHPELLNSSVVSTIYTTEESP